MVHERLISHRHELAAGGLVDTLHDLTLARLESSLAVGFTEAVLTLDAGNVASITRDVLLGFFGLLKVMSVTLGLGTVTSIAGNGILIVRNEHVFLEFTCVLCIG